MKAARATEERQARTVWLNAWHDPVASLKAFTPCVRMCDLAGDSESKLLVASSDKKLKIYTGTTLLSENVLLDAPVSIVPFYPDAKGSPRVPNVAVAAGPFVFIYRNLRPWYKFALPLNEVNLDEQAAWTALHKGKATVDETKAALTTARDAGVQLTSTSQDLLAIDDPTECAFFVGEQRERPLAAQTVCTCMESLKKELEEDDAVSMLVVGTEAGDILVLNPAGTEVVKRWKLPSAPVHMAVTGVKDIEFRIVCACRDGNIHTVKETGPSGAVIELESMPCGLVRLDKYIVVGCMSNVVHAFTLRGKKAYSIYLPDAISCMDLLALNKTRVAKALIVGMQVRSPACPSPPWPSLTFSHLLSPSLTFPHLLCGAPRWHAERRDPSVLGEAPRRHGAHQRAGDLNALWLLWSRGGMLGSRRRVRIALHQDPAAHGQV